MSPRIQADFTNVATGFDNSPLPAGAYLAKIDKITAGKTSDGKKDMITIQMVTEGNDDPAVNGKFVFDRIVMQKNDGSVNGIALSQIKAYAVATIGEEAANSPEGIDTDEFQGGRVQLVLEVQSFQRKNPDGSAKVNGDGSPDTGQSNEIKRVLPAG
jgi:hypothetical protein